MGQYKELKALQHKIPNSEIRQYIGSCGLWEYGLFCKITNLKLNWDYIKGVL